jgi:uncharacterized protein
MRSFKKINYFSLFLLLLFIYTVNINAQGIPEPMSPPRLVNDFAGIFSASETQALEQKLLAYNDSTSTQIYVVTVNDMGGYPASEYSFRLGEKWGIGQKEKDNGVVILIKPKTEDSRGDVFIAVGYGLEAKLNDAYIGRILDNYMIPYFIDNDYFGGVNASADAIIARLSGEFDAEAEGTNEIPALVIIIAIILFFIFIRVIFGKGDQHIDGDGHNRGGGGTIFFPPIIGGNSRNSGGGFGGGGGGSFGGGGAGRSW